MLSGGVRLGLVVAAPALGALLVHELRGRRRLAVGITLAAVLACAALIASLISGLTGGGSVEHTFGTAIPGVDFTARADGPSVAIVLVACLAALLAVPRHRGHGERLAGLLLCLAGTTAVATGGNLVLVTGGVEVIAAGTLLLRGGGGGGARSAMVLAGFLGASGVALVAAAGQLVAGAGSSDLAFVPQGAVGGGLAVPWALGGIGLLLSPAVPGAAAAPRRDWAAVGALPAGFLVLLRLHQSAGGQLPGTAAVTLALVGAAVAGSAAVSALRARSLAAAARSSVAILIGILLSLFGRPLAADGAILAGLFLALELGLIAAPSWTRQPGRWAAASTAALALPGGAAFAVTVVGLGVVAQRGVSAFPQLTVLCAALAAATIAAARALAVPGRGWRPALPGAVIATAAGLAGGLLPGFALGQLVTPLAGGAASVDLDAGALQLPGAGFAGGYFMLAAAILLVATWCAMLIVADEPVLLATRRSSIVSMPALGQLLTIRRRTLPAFGRAVRALATVDHWLETQPRLPLFVGAAAVAVLLFH